MIPEEALKQFQQVTGLRVFAIVDQDGTVWWAKEEYETPTFECTIGDRLMHIDELASAVTAPNPSATQPIEAPGMSALTDEEFAAINPGPNPAGGAS